MYSGSSLVRLLGSKDVSLLHRRDGQASAAPDRGCSIFKENRDRNRRAGMRELSQLTQEYGGYDAEVK